jgi:stage V sporulation protein G
MMTISSKIHRILPPDGLRPGGRKLRAIAEVTLDGVFVIHNVRVIESSKGLFAAMPSYIDRGGAYRDHCFPVTPEFTAAINDVVITAYRDACESLQKLRKRDEYAKI